MLSSRERRGRRRRQRSESRGIGPNARGNWDPRPGGTRCEVARARGTAQARRSISETYRRVGIFGFWRLCGRLRGRKRETDEPLTNIRSKAAAKASLLDTTRDGRFEIDRTPGMGNWSGFLTPNGRLDTRARGFTQQTVNLQFKFGDWCPTEHEAGGGGTH